MRKLTEWLSDNGTRWVEISEDAASVSRRTVSGFTRSIDVLRNQLLSGMDWADFLHGIEILSDDAYRVTGARTVVPLQTHEPRDCWVRSFGYTHREVNGAAAPQRDAPDWYFKGNGNSVVISGGEVTTPFHACGSGYEVEYLCAYLIDELGNPRYCGYTLALDFSDPDLRHRHPSLAGLSKLRQTVISPELILELPPLSTVVSSSVVRDGQLIWQKSSKLGLEQLNVSLPELEAMLFQHDSFCEPGALHFVLLGASISTDRDGLLLQHGDVIRASSEIGDLDIEVAYADEAVRCSCNS